MPDDHTPPSAPPTTRELLADTRHREVVDALDRHEGHLVSMRGLLERLVALEERRVQQADVEITASVERRKLDAEVSRDRWRWALEAVQSRAAAGLAGVVATPIGLALARWLGLDVAAVLGHASAPPGP